MSMTAHYIALLRKEEGTDFGVDFPDFPGCVTAGASLEEAMAMASEALELHTEDMKELPAASSLDEVMADPHNTDAVAVCIAAPTRKSRAIAVRITLDERLLAEIDRVANATGETRSGFLAAAARKRLRQQGVGHTILGSRVG